MKKIGIVDSEWYFIGAEDGTWEYTSDCPLGNQKEVEEEDVIDVLNEYYEVAGESDIALDRKDEDEVIVLRRWFGYELQDLKDEYLDGEYKLTVLDGYVSEHLKAQSIFENIGEIEIRNLIAEGGIAYEYKTNYGYNFVLEIVEDNEDILKLLVKVVDIEEI